MIERTVVHRGWEEPPGRGRSWRFIGAPRSVGGALGETRTGAGATNGAARPGAVLHRTAIRRRLRPLLSEGKGHKFKSCRARHDFNDLTRV